MHVSVSFCLRKSDFHHAEYHRIRYTGGSCNIQLLAQMGINLYLSENVFVSGDKRMRIFAVLPLAGFVFNVIGGLFYLPRHRSLAVVYIYIYIYFYTQNNRAFSGHAGENSRSHRQRPTR